MSAPDALCPLPRALLPHAVALVGAGAGAWGADWASHQVDIVLSARLQATNALDVTCLLRATRRGSHVLGRVPFLPVR